MPAKAADSSILSRSTPIHNASRRRPGYALFAIATTALLMMGQAVAQDPAEVQGTAPEEAPAPATSANAGKNGKVCKYEVQTGSRMKKRTCRTQAQWEARQKAAIDLARQLDSRPIAAEGSLEGQ